jgi:hypothetical protein
MTVWVVQDDQRGMKIKVICELFYNKEEEGPESSSG